MILIDTSAWVEFLRATGSPADHAVTRLVESGAEIATTDVLLLELLAGAGSEEAADRHRRLLLSYEHLPQTAQDPEAAAALYRLCRRHGETVRSLLDCLVAAVALRTGARVLHQDRDYDVLARRAGLLVGEG